MPGTERRRAISELIEDIERARREPGDEQRARLQFIRCVDERLFPEVFTTLRGRITGSAVVDLGRSEVGELFNEEAGFIIAHGLRKNIEEMERALEAEEPRVGKARRDLCFLLTLDELSALIDGEVSFWRRRAGFHAWPAAERAVAAGRPQDGAGAAGATEEVTVETVQASLRDARVEPSRLDTRTKEQAFTIVINLMRAKRAPDARVMLIDLTEVLKQQGDLLSLATAYMLLGNIDFESRELGQALEWYDAAEPYVTRVNDEVKVSDLHHQRGYTHFLKGDLRAAINDFRRALPIDERLGDDFRRALIYRRIGIALEMLNFNTEAEKLFLHALELEDRMGNKAGIARASNHLARLAEKEKDIGRAVQFHARAVQVMEEMNDKRGLASAYHQHANLRFANGELDMALGLYRRALTIEKENKDPQSVARILTQIALVFEKKGEFSQAVGVLKTVVAILRRLHSPLLPNVERILRGLEKRVTKPS